ncbi:MAG: alpha/beta hydrolase [Flavisolibacter sp.]|jgi:pimeloyl-ACP methyl ester carboxylesterase|nr:alpha/beta hydrolase [Flavisolibacter sp.]
MKAYLISGLGADARIFVNTKLPQQFQPVYINWIAPEKDESLVAYAKRLSAVIDPNEPFILIGLSFGGMIAVEIAKLHPPAALFLISSIPCIQHLPRLYKVAGKFGFHRIIPIGLFINASLVKRLFTTETRSDKKLLKEMIRDSDPAFIRWAFHAVLTWNNTDIPGTYIHIHGSDDLLLPLVKNKTTIVVRKGGHLMIVNRAAEINRILEEQLAAC